MKAHGIMMIFAWILFVPTAILLARYFKPSFPEKKLCGKAIWFSIHRAVMITVVVLTIIAFILILVYEKGKWVSQDNQREFAHSILGIITICFAIIQPIMALFRCHPDGEYRFVFNYAHRFVGLSALILSIITIFNAVRMHKAFMLRVACFPLFNAVRMHKAFMLRVACFPLFFLLLLLLFLSRRTHFTLLPNDLDNYKSYNFRSKEKIKMLMSN